MIVPFPGFAVLAFAATMLTLVATMLVLTATMPGFPAGMLTVVAAVPGFPIAMFTFAVAALTIVLSVPIGTATAIAFTRYHLKWRAAASTIVMIPLFVPPVIIGLSALTFHRTIGIWGTHFSIAVAHSLWAVPLVYIVLRSTLSGVDRSVEEAAAGLGASPIRVFFEVTLPLVASGIFVGVLFAFIISVNDFIMALFLSTADIKTLPVAIWPQIRYLLTPIVAAASSVIIAITVVLLVVAARATNLRRLVEFR